MDEVKIEVPTHQRQSRLRVLLLAYSISPIRGSEYSVGWNHLKYMSEACDIVVLYGLSGPHMGDLKEIEEHVRSNPFSAAVRLVPIRPNGLARLLNAPNRAGFLVYSFYLAYRVWHWQAAKQAVDIIKKERIDLVHYLCPIGYREPGYLWTLGKPYVWGPIGGMANGLRLPGAPRPFAASLKSALKNVLNQANLVWARRVPKALRRADVVVAATSEVKKILADRFGVAARLVQENAIPDEWLDEYPVRTRDGGPARLIWIGSLDWRKAPDLLLDALELVGSTGWHLHIVGTGPLLGMVCQKIEAKNLKGNVTLHGQVPRAEVHRLLAESDLHLVTSMAEGNPTTIWEAMAAGVPTLTLDHCGMHDVVCDACGVRVDPTTYIETRDRIAEELRSLLSEPETLLRLREGVARCRERHVWSNRKETWLSIYRDAMTAKAVLKN